MKTAMGKAKVWISEGVGTKIATRLFRGLALGALLVAATGLYFSINQGEAGSALVSGRIIECYPVAGFCSNDLEALVVGGIREHTSRSLPVDYSLVDWEEMTPAEVAGSPLGSERIVECYPVAGFCSNDLEALVVAGTREHTSRSLPVDYSLVDWEEMTPAEVVSSRLSSEQLEFVYDLEMMGIPWQIDGQGKVVVVEAPRGPTAARLSYYEAVFGADISYPDPWS